jgi:hypothetical protein
MHGHIYCRYACDTIVQYIDALFNGNTFLLHTLYFIELSNMAVCIL